MGKKQSEAQKYVSLAKQRLVSNDYSQYEKNASCHFYVNNKKVSKEELAEMSVIASEIAASDTLVYDALDRLIPDKEFFLTLGETERVKYVLDVSKIYETLREETRQ